MEDQAILTKNDYESNVDSTNQILKMAKISPETVEINVANAQSVSSTSCSFRINSSPSLLLSRKMVLELPISVWFDCGAGNVARPWQIAPRADTINAILSNCSISVNGGSLVSRPFEITQVTPYYSRTFDKLTNGGELASNPNTFDLQYARGLTFTGADQTTYADNQLDNRSYSWREEHGNVSFPSRLSQSVYRNIGIAEVASAGAPSTRYFGYTFFLRAMIKHPLFSSSSSEMLCNVDSLQIDLTFDTGKIKERGFFGTIPQSNVAQIADASVFASVGVVNDYTGATSPSALFNTTDFRINYYTVQPKDVNSIPDTQTLVCEQFYSNKYSIGQTMTAYAPNAGAGTDANINSKQVIHNEISISSVPTHMWVFVTPEFDINNKNMYTSDVFLPISNLQMVVNGRTLDYTQMKVKDWYNQCTRNGLKVPFSSFNNYRDIPIVSGLNGGQLGKQRPALTAGTLSSNVVNYATGVPICFRISQNLSGGLIENLNTNTRVQLRYTVHNTFPDPWTNLISNVVWRNNDILVLSRSSPLRIVSGLSSEEVSQALSSGYMQSVTSEEDSDELDNLIGGGGFSDMFRQGGKNFLKFLNVGSRLLGQASEIYPELNPQLVREVQRANQLGQRVQESGVLGSGGGAMLGGSRLEMLKNSGLLR